MFDKESTLAIWTGIMHRPIYYY